MLDDQSCVILLPVVLKGLLRDFNGIQDVNGNADQGLNVRGNHADREFPDAAHLDQAQM
jgi:hypothetical protein